MANRLFTSQFSYSFEKQIVELAGAFTQVGGAIAKASLILQDLTYTADAYGDAGNSITIRYVTGGTAGAEVVTVVGTAISVSMDATPVTGSTATQIKAAVDASAPASALISVSVSGTGSTVQAAVAATPLAGGHTTVFSNNLPLNIMSLAQVDVGLYTLTLSDSYPALLSCSMMLQTASAKDLSAQLISEGVNSTKIINFRMIAGATETSLASGDVLYIDLKLRNVR